MDQIAHDVVAFIRTHPELAALVIGATAFAESLAFIGLLFPGVTFLFAAGVLVHTGVINPVPTLIAATAGAFLGEAISYWIGQRFGAKLPHITPFRKNPHALEKSMDFFQRWGWASVFIGQFLGSLRGFVSLTAGMCRMRVVPFCFASVASAAAWAFAVLLAGYLIGGLVTSGTSIEKETIENIVGFVVIITLIWAWGKFFTKNGGR